MPDLTLTGDPDADRLLSEDPLALLIGMLLDQQVTMESAFAAPARLAERLGGSFDAATIAGMDPDRLEEVFREKPALHRYPGSMAKRVHALCAWIVEHAGGDAARIWEDAADGAELVATLKGLPGFGDQKARIFTALLGKQCGVTPTGWREAAGEYGQPGYRSIADVTSTETLEQVRASKQARKAEAKRAAAG
ncbi:MAG: Fe-S cluster assembly protein HesB [Actinobacteria bacterium]|nr:Fe-S cluster assembly protein HesB [Actinomycetota bacterium]